MKKKLTALALVVVMVAMLFTGLTMAYFTDNETVTNTFTVGSIEIDVFEHDIDDPNKEVEENHYENVVPGKPYPKDPTIENVGNNDAYARMKVTVPLDVFEAIAKVEGAELEKIFIGYDEDLWDRVSTARDTENNTVTYVYNYANEETEGILKADANAKLFTEFKLPEKLTQEVMADWDAFYIKVVGEAIQAEGFDNAEDAFKALDEVAAPIEGMIVAFDSTSMVEALEAGENVLLAKDIKIDPANMSNAYGTTGINVKNGQTIDGNGNTLDIKGAGGTWDSGINTTGGVIKNLTVTGSFRGIFINHNSTYSEPVVLDNVTIDGTTYTISCDQGMNQGLTATNSTFNGWTSYAATLGDAKFVDCSFGKGNGYAYMRPYAPTEFVGCEFEAGFQMDARAKVTFENCTIGGVALTAENLATLVTSNTANATVK